MDSSRSSRRIFVGELDLNTKLATNAFLLIAAVRRQGYSGDVPPLPQLLEALAQHRPWRPPTSARA
jgi:hypothetical protein